MGEVGGGCEGEGWWSEGKRLSVKDKEADEKRER